MRMQTKVMALVLGLGLTAAACGDDTTEDGRIIDPVNNESNNVISDLVVPTTYTFESRSQPGESSVSYSGQVFRQVLIEDLKGYIGGLTDAIDSGDFLPASEGEVVAALDFYFRFDSETAGGETIGLTTDPATLQTTYDDISSGKDLVGKLAGNDSVTDHEDWSTEFGGWSDETIAQYGGGIDTPENLILAFFETIEAQAISRANGSVPTLPDLLEEPLPVHVTESGLDLQQLTQKFLLGAVTYSQGTDDYLDDDTEGKGLLASNAIEEGEAHSALEHAWDEGFGYFGAARTYGDMSDDEIASEGYQDADDDGAIDLLSEYSFGNSTNAAKRDRGAAESAATDLTKDAFEAFLTGRAIIAAAGDELEADELTALRGQRDLAVLAWEKAIAATIVHYINEVLVDMGTFGSDDYDFLAHAKHWSELKGFALGLQFNPHSPLGDEDFATFHTLVGDAPTLPEADEGNIEGYRNALRQAREILADTYGFDAANLGDDDGKGGW